MDLNNLGKLWVCKIDPYSWPIIILESSFVFIVHLLVFHYIYPGNLSPFGYDGYYHYAIADMLDMHNLAQDIDFLPYTYMGSNHTDHHWLFHWLIKPLTYLPEISSYSISNAVQVWGAVLPAVLNVILRACRVQYSPLFATLAVWIVTMLPERFLMLRAQNLGLIYMAVLLVLANNRKYWAFGIVLFLFNQSYQAAVLIVFILLSVFVKDLVCGNKFDKKLIKTAIVGIGASLILSPWFPQNIEFLVFHLMTKIHNPFDVLLLSGFEWRSLKLEYLLHNIFPSLFLLLFSVVALFVSRGFRKDDKQYQLALVFLILALLMFVMLIRHIRFVELYGPLSVIAAAISMQMLLNKKTLSNKIAVLCILFTFSLAVIKPVATRGEDYVSLEKMSEFCEYINANARPGDLLFNGTPIDSFVKLVKCAPQLKYVAGLDGNMLAYGNVDLFMVWYRFYLNAVFENDKKCVYVEELQEAVNLTRPRFFFFYRNQVRNADFVLKSLDNTELVVKNRYGFLIEDKTVR